MCISKDMLIEIVYNAIARSSKSISRKIKNDVAERSFYCDIIAGLIHELEKKNLSNYFIDSEYNRAIGFDGIGKGVGVYNEENQTIERLENNTFDIIVHLDGTGNIKYPENLIHIEVKKRKNIEGQEKDKQRLLSTTKFPDKLSTQYLGIIFEPDKFISLYNIYKGKCSERAEQIEKENQLDEIIKINQEIFDKYKVDYSKTEEWFSNIIAGYQIGAFIDIGENDIIIEYYYSGMQLCERHIVYK